jgi:hypothetical protein
MKREEVVLKQLNETAAQLKKSAFKLGSLLHEVNTKKFHMVWGFESFREWLEQSELGISIREALYLMNVVEKTTVLNLKPTLVEQCKVSALKHIFTLDTQKYGSEIVKLLSKASKGASLSDVRHQVNIIKGKQEQIVYSVGLPSEKAKATVRNAINTSCELGGFSTDGEAVLAIFSFFLKNKTKFTATIAA